ncbi:hypothetical protein RJ639_035360 [Escallonia herrerae]|uniref:Reverse transcriptase Ty1/copia-type domain-containing protein n=1 Tax=Escallonia herrerae TaxID=1293975 RepID=A0AA88WPD4_9ASTE|nr:hypothetical protein RJ639_035360 [Escallonia herrerae]
MTLRQEYSSLVHADKPDDSIAIIQEALHTSGDAQYSPSSSIGAPGATNSACYPTPEAVHQMIQANLAAAISSMRLSGPGNGAEYAVDYEETLAPVAKMTNVRLLLFLAASQDWPLLQMDVKNALLHPNLSETVHMSPPPGLDNVPSSYDLVKLARLYTARYVDTPMELNVRTDPRHLHMSSVQRIISYLRGHPSTGLSFPSDNTTCLKAYADAGWAGPNSPCSEILWLAFRTRVSSIHVDLSSCG